MSVSSAPPCSLIQQPSCHWCLYITVLPHVPPPLSRYLDNLPTSGNAHGRAFRDLEWEERVLELTRKTGIGAQFGGKCLTATACSLPGQLLHLPPPPPACPHLTSPHLCPPPRQVLLP